MITNLNQDLVGVGAAEIVKADVDGNNMRESHAGVTEARRWVHYPFRHSSGQERVKHMWLIHHDGILIGSDRLGLRANGLLAG